MITNLRAPSVDAVTISHGFWAEWQRVNREVTLRIEYQQLKQTGRIDAFHLDWKPGQPNRPHHFWDSDVAKWLEAVGYSLATHPDPELEALADDAIDLIAAAQQSDGYLNIYYTVVEPDKRWTNLRDMHELYCAGHLMEAAVACYQGTGKRVLLDVLCRYADHIDATFGPESSKRRGYPGHEEIELALIKLYRVTGVERYLRLAQFFVNERGRQPHYYDLEARDRGDDPAAYRFREYSYNQSHLPIREQETAEGHSVRAMYLYSGVADVAVETGDDSLLPPLQRLWENVTGRRMYVTGGIGSSEDGERFTYDYDLPNATAYTETCAAIGLVFWASRMLQIGAVGDYADVMERALYNGVLSGLSLDGTRFFYANPLEVNRQVWDSLPEARRRGNIQPQRQEWFSCACCPPNIARLLASLGSYAYSQGPGQAYVHLYLSGSATLDVGSGRVVLRQETDYPWSGDVSLSVEPESALEFSLGLRIPGWCREATLTVNDEPVDLAASASQGYAVIARAWQPGDRLAFHMSMPVERVRARPEVWMNAGRIALQRGPLVYCLEAHEVGEQLNDLAIPWDAGLEGESRPNLLGGVVAITGRGARSGATAWDDALYLLEQPGTELQAVEAIPYYAWANRDLASMLVWVREA